MSSEVTIDRSIRIPPLDMPVKAEWLGVLGSLQVGTVSRETRYRVSVLDEQSLKKIEGTRKATRDLLDRLSFPLSDGVRWMPHDAKALFEQEMDRCNNEGQLLLSSLVEGDAVAFVNGRRDKISRDANEMYREFHPGMSLQDSVIDELVSGLTERLRKGKESTILPKVTFRSIALGVADGLHGKPVFVGLNAYIKK